MSDFWIGLFMGLFLGLMAGYFIAKTAFNRATTKVAKYILDGRQRTAQTAVKGGR